MASRAAWTTWLLGRVLSGIGTVVFLSAVVFVATQGLPSDPARVILGPEATDESVRILQRQLGLDLPLHHQYLRWLENLLKGDVGTSLVSGRAVSVLIADRIACSMSLVLLVMTLATPTAVALGVWLSVKRDTWIDRSVVACLIGIKAVPVFGIAMGLVMLFSTRVFSVLPAVSMVDPARPIWSQLEIMVLPVLTLVLSSVPYLARLVRASVSETLGAEYIVQARLRGVPERRLLFVHVLPNALIPAIQGAALSASVMIGGSLVVEVVFNFPGLGSLLNSAVESRDLPIIQSVVLILSSSVVCINVMADVLTVMLTPKLRTTERARGWKKRDNTQVREREPKLAARAQ